MTTQLDNAEADKFRTPARIVLTSGEPDVWVYDRDLLRLYAIELKRGRDPWHDYQPAFAQMLGEVGVPYILARDADSVLRIGLENIPRDYQPPFLMGRHAAIENDPLFVTRVQP